MAAWTTDASKASNSILHAICVHSWQGFNVSCSGRETRENECPTFPLRATSSGSHAVNNVIRSKHVHP